MRSSRGDCGRRNRKARLLAGAALFATRAIWTPSQDTSSLAWSQSRTKATHTSKPKPSVPERRHGGSSKSRPLSEGLSGAVPSGLAPKRGSVNGLKALSLESNPDSEDPKTTTFLGTYLAYASCYLARNNAAVAKVPLLALLGAGSITVLGVPELQLSAAGAFGALDACFLLAYTLGFFALPAVIDVDRRNPWEIVWNSLVVVGVTQIAMCFIWQSMIGGLAAYPFALAALACFVNGAAQSCLYPSCKQLMANAFGVDGTVLGTWNTCYYFGGVASTLIAAALTDSFGWQAAFLIPGLMLLAFGSIGAMSVPKADSSDATAAAANVPDSGVQSRLGELFWPSEVQLRAVSGQYFSVKLVRYAFGLWLPLLLAVGHGSTGGSLLLEVGGSAALFDIGSMAGSLAFGALSKELGSAWLPTLVLGSTASLAALLALVPSLLGQVADAPFLATGALLLALGVSTGGGETLLGSIAPIHYASKVDSKISVATAVAAVNGWGSLGTVVAAILLPFLAGNGTDLSSLPQAFGSLAPLCWGAAALAAGQVLTEMLPQTDPPPKVLVKVVEEDANVPSLAQAAEVEATVAKERA